MKRKQKIKEYFKYLKNVIHISVKFVLRKQYGYFIVPLYKGFQGYKLLY